MLIICLINTGLYSDWLPLWDKSWAFIFYFNIPWATSSYTLHHSSANNGGPANFSYGGYQYKYMGDQCIFHWLTPISIVNSVLMILLFQTMVLWPIVPSCIKDGGWWGSWSCLEENPQDPEPAESSTTTIDHNLKASVDLHSLCLLHCNRTHQVHEPLTGMDWRYRHGSHCPLLLGNFPPVGSMLLPLRNIVIITSSRTSSY